MASLELTREGKLEIRQADPFGPIWLKDRGDMEGVTSSDDVPTYDPH